MLPLELERKPQTITMQGQQDRDSDDFLGPRI